MESDTATALPQARALDRALSVGRRLPAHLLIALCLCGAWLMLAPRSPDLAAQAYRSYLFAHFGMLIFDGNWYGGHHIPSYSLLYPPLAALLGMRPAGALAVLASTALFGRIARIGFGEKTRLASVAFAVAAAGDLWIGRLTFALGVTFALGAVVLLLEDRGRVAYGLAGVCAALSAASSPVAGLLLGLAAVTYAIARRSLLLPLVLIGPALIVVLPLQALFPEGGFEPYGLESFLPATAVALAFLWALPSSERLLRIGGSLFLLVNAISLLPTPMGSNIVRYAVLLAAPLLLCALASNGGFSAAARPLWALIAALAGIGLWVLWGPITQSTEVLKDPSTQASYYLPLRRFLASHAKGPLRIEVPFTRSHWEAALLAPHLALARGWERQLDKRYDEAIEADPLPASVYRRWLHRNAVSYVALPDVPLDGSSLGEAALIRHGAPFLIPVFSSAHWRVYAMEGSSPLAEGPGKLLSLRHQGFTLEARAAGRFLVRVRYTPYWSVRSGVASVFEGVEGWTSVQVRQRGSVNVQARFSLSGALKAIEGL